MGELEERKPDQKHEGGEAAGMVVKEHLGQAGHLARSGSRTGRRRAGQKDKAQEKQEGEAQTEERQEEEEEEEEK